MKTVPSRAEFAELARRHSVVPVAMTVLADRETPVTLFDALVGDRPGFLLESVEGGDRWARWSFVGWDPAFTITVRNGAAEVDAAIGLPDGDNPLDVLERILARYTTPDVPGLPPLHSGAVGYIGYDMVRHIERLSRQPEDDRGLPEMMLQFVGSLAAFDRFSQTVVLVRNVFVDPGADLDTAYEEAVDRLQQAAAAMERPASRPVAVPDIPPPPSHAPSTFDRTSFEDAVERAKEYIYAGDAFQIVLSQRMEAPFDGDAFGIYRALRVINPSPFLYFIRHPDVAIAGSSPELMTRVRDGKVYSRPIAGTRPRGATEEEDRRLAEELLADPKERAEHVMLIDLARNDVGRVSEYGSVTVDELMVIERYSHVMHIVSGVSGTLREGVSPLDVLRATFPHGTVSGAPKVRAMEIIDELEPVARGPYAGAVGYIDFSGNVDTAICLRTVVVAGGSAWVQAGAGIVADSDPAAEYEETRNKAAAALAAVEMGRRLQ